MGWGAGGASAPQQVERTRLGSKPERREPPRSYIGSQGTRIGPWQQGWRSKPIPISHLQKLAFVLPNVFQMGTQRENSLQPMGTGSSPLTGPHRAPPKSWVPQAGAEQAPKGGRAGLGTGNSISQVWDPKSSPALDPWPRGWTGQCMAWGTPNHPRKCTPVTTKPPWTHNGTEIMGAPGRSLDLKVTR